VLLLVLIGGRPQSADVLALCFLALTVIGALAFAIVLPIMRMKASQRLSGHAGAPRLGGVLAAVRHWQFNPGVFQLLLGTMLIQMGVFVVITFTTPILADRFGQSLEDLLWLLLIIHVVAVPSTLAWSHMDDGRLTLCRNAGIAGLLGVVLLLLAFGTGPWMPLVTVTVIGCCLGATFSGLRGFLAENIGVPIPWRSSRSPRRPGGLPRHWAGPVFGHHDRRG
jgi:predicted MFS family arabinose efflux permease